MTEVELLRSEVDRLQKMVSSLEAKAQMVPHFGLAAITTETPIQDYRNTNNPSTMEEVVFAYRYDKSASAAWRPFTMLAKELCKCDSTFYMSTIHPGSRVPCVRDDGFGVVPKRFENIPFEKLVLAGQMIDEMIRIWNRYYKMIHKTAKYRSGRELKEAEIVDLASTGSGSLENGLGEKAGGHE